MPATAKVIADSISPDKIRITSLQLRYQRFIHAEFLTHRMFSRNSSSTRTIPLSKQIEAVLTDPAMPTYWGANQAGMQAEAELDPKQRQLAHSIWLQARDSAVFRVRQLEELGLHKQLAGRLLEPWSYINTIVTATSFDNFFDLRCHPAAQPEMQELAFIIKYAIEASTPVFLPIGSWHLPYINEVAEQHADAYVATSKPDLDEIDILLRMSAARCARVSYAKHDGQYPSVEEDLTLYNRLVGSKPCHASPCEHQATPDVKPPGLYQEYDNPQLHGNFYGWIQHRKLIEEAERKASSGLVVLSTESQE